MSTSPASSPRRVSVVIPVKGLGTAKTRTHLPASQRAELALDLMTRTVTAALDATSVARVIVVAGDDEVARVATSLGALALAEPAGSGLNGAIAAGRDLAQHGFDDDIVIMVGDLADPDPSDLDAVVVEFQRTGQRLLVPDHLGTGTTMLLHEHGACPPLLFGADSAARHEAAGYRRALQAPISVRHDVDCPDDVAALSR